MPQDKINAYMTLYTALVTVAKAAAPLIPFMADEIYMNLVCSVDSEALKSVHLCDFPSYDEKLIDNELEEEMEEAIKIVVLGRAARNNANIKNRQPIGKMYVKAGEKLNDMLTDVIKDELNIKNVEFCDDVTAFTSYSFKPQLKTLGRRFGKNINLVREILASIDGNAAMAELNSTDKLTIEVDGKNEELSRDDLLIDSAQTDGYEANSDSGITVVIETTLSPELLDEGMLREIISKVQTMRKDAGFEVMDHIALGITSNDKLKSLVDANAEYVMGEVLADVIDGSEKANAKQWNINGESVTLSVEKLS